MTDDIRKAATEAACVAFAAHDMQSFARWTEEEQAEMRENMARAVTAYERAMWRPIAECPPDKFNCYLVTRDGNRPVRAQRYRHDGPFRLHGTIDSILDGGDAPTHFRPLPAPPELLRGLNWRRKAQMQNEDAFFVEVMPRSGDTSDPGYRRYGPMPNREAVRLDSGLNINLHHGLYYTVISAVGCEGKWRSGRGMAAEREALERGS